LEELIRVIWVRYVTLKTTDSTQSPWVLNVQSTYCFSQLCSKPMLCQLTGLITILWLETPHFNRAPSFYHNYWYILRISSSYLVSAEVQGNFWHMRDDKLEKWCPMITSPYEAFDESHGRERKWWLFDFHSKCWRVNMIQSVQYCRNQGVCLLRSYKFSYNNCKITAQKFHMPLTRTQCEETTLTFISG